MIIKTTLLLALTAAASLGGTTPAQAGDSQGAVLLEERCSVCHPSARPKGAKKSPAEWDATVSRMIGKGARLSAEERAILVDYLSKTYKP